MKKRTDIKCACGGEIELLKNPEWSNGEGYPTTHVCLSCGIRFKISDKQTDEHIIAVAQRAGFTLIKGGKTKTK